MTTLYRLRERAKETFHVALEDSFRTGKWDPILQDAYENAEEAVNDVEQRFWKQLDQSGGPEACWPWTGYRSRAGYGQIKVAGKQTAASRVSLALAGSPVPEDQFALHHCDNPPCVNPAHLFIGTNRDNALDMVAKGRDRPWLRERTHCKNGHEFTPENTAQRRGSTRRVCRACAATRSRAINRAPRVCECGQVRTYGSMFLHRQSAQHARDLMDRALNAEADLRWEEAQMALDAVMESEAEA